MSDKMRDMLNSDDSDQQQIALYTIMHEGNKLDYMREVLKCTESSDKMVRLPAYMVLDKVRSKKVIPYLERALKDELPKIRMLTAITLSKFNNIKAIPVLKEIIENDIKDHSIHKRAIEALGRYKDEQHIDIFEKLLHHRRKVSRIKAAEALYKIGTDRTYKILFNALTEETDTAVLSRIKSVLIMSENKA